MTRARSILHACALALVAAAPVAVQTRVTAEQAMAGPDGSVRAFVRVTDGDGRAVRPDSASLVPLVDGRRAPLVGVSAAREAPLGVVFVVCLDRAQRPTDHSATIAAFAAFADGLGGAARPGDRAALVTCGDRARIVLPWSPPADVRRALDGLRATDDEADEAEALRLAATLPPLGLRRLALVRTDGRHLDPPTEADVAAAGLPVFPMPGPTMTDALPLVTLARATGGSYLDGAPADVLTALRDRLAASWQIDTAAPDSAARAWFSVRIGAVTSARVRIAAEAPTAADAAPASGTPAAADGGGAGWLVWVGLGALAIAAVAGWVFFGHRLRRAPASVGGSMSRGADADAAANAAAPPSGDDLPPLPPLAPPVPVRPGVPRLTLVGAGGTVIGTAVLDRPRIVGRSEGADVRITDAAASARHAEVWFDGSRVRIRDLGSTNGLVVDGATSSEAPLASGSRIVIGETTVTAAIDGLADDPHAA